MNVQEALQQTKGEIAKRHENHIRALYNEMVAKLGPKLTNVHNDWTYAKAFVGTIRPCTKWEGDTREGYYTLDEDALQRVSQRMAESTVKAWEDKILSKTDGMTDINVVSFTGTTFILFCKKGKWEIGLEQSMIIKTSSKGTVFNQFPARFFIGGIMVSEKYVKGLNP